MTFLQPLAFNLVFGLVAKHKFYFKNIFLKSISVNTGYIFSQRINENEILGLPYYGWGTLGLSFKILPGNVPIDFNYALLPEYENTIGLIHSFSFSFQLGKSDTQKPKINFGNLQGGGSIDNVPAENLPEDFFKKKLDMIRIFIFLFFMLSFGLSQSTIDNSNRYFSPNLDGVKDSIFIPLNIDESSLFSWEILIYQKDAQGYKLIWKERSKNSVEIRKLTARKYFDRLFQPKTPVIVPKSIEWNGYSRIPLSKKEKSFRSSKVPDAIYYFKIIATDEQGNKNSTSLIPIIIDTVSPQVSLAASDTIFSPNLDGNKETYSLNFSFQNINPLDTFKYKILNKKNQEVFARTLRGSEIKKKTLQWEWDGKNNNGKLQVEGSYQVVFESFDYAGNRMNASSQEFTLIQKFEEIYLSSTKKGFAPNDNGYNDLMPFNVSVSSLKGMKKWEFFVINKSKDILYQLSGDRFSPFINFAGRGNNNNKITDGDYQAYIQFFYDSGNQPLSDLYSFNLDTTAPKVTLEIKNKDKLFIPKLRENNKLIISHSFHPASLDGSEKYTAIILDETGNQVLTKNLKENNSDSFIWDGKNESGFSIPGRYLYKLVGIDQLGNRSVVESDVFELIDELAEFSVSADSPAFSPNGDGNLDRIHISIKTKRQNIKRVIKQKLELLNGDKVIKVFKNTSYKENYQWDGKGDNGEISPDGQYTIRLHTELSGGEKSVVLGQKVTLDTNPIAIELYLPEDVFSPNGDGRKDVLLVNQKLITSQFNSDKDFIRLDIINPNGKIYRSIEFENGKLPPLVNWNGLDQLKKICPEGIYYWVLSTRDLAGNTSKFKSPAINLIRKNENILVYPNNNFFSYRSPIQKPIEMSLDIDNPKYLESYQLLFENENSETFLMGEYRDFKKKAISLTFNGTNDKGEILKDGVYQSFIKGYFANGNEVFSKPFVFDVDSQGADIKINTRPKYFSPDGDGVDESLDINVSLFDNNPIKASEVFIFRKLFSLKNKPFKQSLANYISNAPVFKRWSKADENQYQLNWNGKNNQNNQLVESANDYVIFVRAKDLANNISIASKDITVDILVEKAGEDRYKIIINSINFQFNSDKMLGTYKKTLNRLAVILNKFSSYKIEITGHTDSKGSEEYNLKLSQKRARSVYNYLVNRDISSDRMSIEGRGETELLYPKEEFAEEKRKNRRVEFYLIKEPI